MFKECITCTKRHIGCHNTCESYLRDKEKCERIKELKQKDFASRYIYKNPSGAISALTKRSRNLRYGRVSQED
jgi:hypothetical protein